VDHHHTVRGTNSWTAELGRSNEGGFWPSGQTIIDIATRHQPMFRKIALTAGATFAIADVTVTEGPGSNGNGTVEAGELGDVVVTVQNAGLAAAAASLYVQSLTAGVVVTNGLATAGTVAQLASAQNTVPMTFVVGPGVTAPSAQLRVQVSGDGRTTERIVDVDLIARRLVLRDDFELDRGFVRAPGGTATTGLWERAAPQLTTNGNATIQPGTQTTPGGTLCWVTDGRGGSAGTYDVDGGFTDLLTPVMDLSHMMAAEARLAYWYAESVGDDAMEVEISRDGGSNWSPAFSRSTSTGAWTALSVDFGAPLTTRMQLRVRAQDLAPSLVECLIDDFEVHGQLPDGSITLLASGAPGTNVQVAISAEATSLCFTLASLGTIPGQSYPGVGGTLLVNPATALALPLTIADAGGRAAFELALPAGPGFPGLVFHLQCAVFGTGGAAFGPNRTALSLQ
jgi:hypothetical protein